jgi:hypothetical protein
MLQFFSSEIRLLCLGLNGLGVWEMVIPPEEFEELKFYTSTCTIHSRNI